MSTHQITVTVNGAARSAEVESRLLLGEILLEAGRPRDALEALEHLLSEGRLRPLPVASADGHRTIRADQPCFGSMERLIAAAAKPIGQRNIGQVSPIRIVSDFHRK